MHKPLHQFLGNQNSFARDSHRTDRDRTEPNRSVCRIERDQYSLRKLPSRTLGSGRLALDVGSWHNPPEDKESSAHHPKAA
jgi:hypothetical protein